jgi:hypothetical protein
MYFRVCIISGSIQFCSIQHTSKDELSDITSAVTELVSNLLDVGLETEIKEELSGESRN